MSGGGAMTGDRGSSHSRKAVIMGRRGHRSIGEQERRKRGSRKIGGRPGWGIPQSAAHLTTHSSMSEGAEAAKPSTPDNAPSGDVLLGEQSSQRLKAMLLEMTNGSWEVCPKDRGFAVKFCWRDPDFQTLKQRAPDEVEKSTYVQISAHFCNLSMNHGRRDKV